MGKKQKKPKKGDGEKDKMKNVFDKAFLELGEYENWEHKMEKYILSSYKANGRRKWFSKDDVKKILGNQD